MADLNDAASFEYLSAERHLLLAADDLERIGKAIDAALKYNVAKSDRHLTAVRAIRISFERATGGSIQGNAEQLAKALREFAEDVSEIVADYGNPDAYENA